MELARNFYWSMSKKREREEQNKKRKVFKLDVVPLNENQE
jgi:ribosomal protein S21